MALSNPEPNAVPLESESRTSLRPTSPVVSGFSTYGGAMVPKVWAPPFPQQQCPTLPRQSLDFDVPQLQRASIIEGVKEATTHDFLSLYGGKNASLSETTVTRGLASSVTTQNLLQPLEKGSGLSSRGPVTVAGLAGQETGFALVNGTLDLPSNALYRVDRADFVTGRRHEDVSEIPRQWAAGDTSQKLEAKSSDSKESTPKSTPRSKHSAMEQRRRTKINDRFQMLRQLVPNVDQKRDKASFLLEVIDYVKVLQEKARKYEAAEQSRQQERLKPILWDVSQRNPGCRDSSADSAHIPLVPAVPLDTQKASDSTSHMSPLPATRENEVSGAELMSCLGQAVALSDRPAQGPQAPHSSSDSKVVISRTTTVPLTCQMSAVSVLESSSCMPHFVPRATPEPQAMFGHVHYHDKQTAISKGSAYKRVEGQSNEEFDSLKAGQVLEQHSKETGIALRELEKDNGRLVTDVNSPKAEQKSKVKADKQADEKEQIGVQGGVINVSSLYSKGLLDTLTRALQSSGLDLSKATISVQIDLGRPGTGNIAASSRRTSSQSTELCNESGSSPELEHPAKRSKVEVDV